MAPLDELSDIEDDLVTPAEVQKAPPAPVLRLQRGSSREEALKALDTQQASNFGGGIDLSMLGFDVDDDLVKRALEFCGAANRAASQGSTAGVSLRLAHNDLGSGTDCEQRILQLRANREAKEREKTFYEQKKRDSSKQKDFSASANMRRQGEAGIATAIARLEEIDTELAELDARKVDFPWYVLLEALKKCNSNAITRLDLADCGLHATGVVMLTRILLDLEHRSDGVPVTHLVLDGNDLRDTSMGALASYLKLSSHMQALQLRNVGITDQGFSEVCAGLVGNKGLALLDLRDNGLCTPAVNKEVTVGIRRFNPKAEVLLG